MTRRVNENEEALVNTPNQLVAIFAIAVSGVWPDDSVRISKGCRCVSEIKASIPKTSVTLAFIPLKVYVRSIVQ